MSNLFASLTTAAKSMKAYEQALTVVQNNVTNASTPGYVRQQVDFVALAFQPDRDLHGGVEAGSLISSRDRFSERAVWRQAEGHGRLDQLLTNLGQIEPIFDVAGGSGITGAIDRFFSTFSRLSVTPNDIPARENVIREAREVARAFNYSAASLARAEENSRRGIGDIAGQINGLAENIRDLNVEFRKDYRNAGDAGLDARLNTALEELSSLVDINALPQADGTVSVFLGGQTPLVMGDKTCAISADLSGPAAVIRNFDNKDVTSQVQRGKLKGALEFHNERLPEYMGELNHLAETFAGRVNTELAGGVDLNGLPPATELFTFTAPESAAVTMAVTGITAGEIAAASPASPGGNANALNLASLATSKEVDGFTFTEYYGRLSATVGGDIEAAREDEHSAGLLLAQAKYLRDQGSAVDLNEEAAALLEHQRAYQAIAQLVRTLDEMTQTAMGILR